MSQREITVKKRTIAGKEASKRLRKSGELPAVLYGHHETPVSLSLNARAFSDLIHHHGLHSLLVLQGDGGGETAIIKDIQRHPVKGTPATVDFLRVSRNEKVTVTVAVILTGEPEGVKTGDGVLVQSLHEVQIRALPAETPESIHVDVSGLVTNGAALTLGEVALPAGVELITDAGEAVAVVNLPHAEPVVEPVAEAEAPAEAPAEAEADTTETEE
jgi:large subunit ribosomal protein L25